MPNKAFDDDYLKLKKNQFETIRFILGDQLNAEHSWFNTTDQNVLYILAELHQEQEYVTHHIQKICAFFKSMENFANSLKQAGHHVLYLDLDMTSQYSDLCHLLISLLEHFNAAQFDYQRPDEHRLVKQFEAVQAKLTTTNTSSIIVNCVDTEHFILPFDDIPTYFKAGKHVRMENFYRAMRKRFNILMEDNQPLGGQWNYDNENRKSLSKSDLENIPEPLLFPNDVTDILARLKRHNIKHIGKCESSLLWPCSRQQARELLSYFCSQCLPNFGRFQDAMTENSRHAWSLYHSRISFALNAKTLHPLDVIETAIEAFYHSNNTISLAQIEGFVRQILGWREYVRGMYWVNMPNMASLNDLNAKRALPSWFWDGNTKMNCISKAVSQSLEFAYAHHIQRLMITGNFALLAGLDPDEVDAWYLGIYIDAIEWVELPNTRGMALSADGGLIATKPYAASGNYINKMSDYCKSCHYSVKTKTGDKACPFNSLYWYFLNHHKETFQKNSRMAFPYKAWQRMNEVQQDALLQQAELYLNDIESL